MLLKIPVVFPETLMHINIRAGPAGSVSVWMRQAFGGYLGEPSRPRDPPHTGCAASCAVQKPPCFGAHKPPLHTC